MMFAAAVLVADVFLSLVFLSSSDESSSTKALDPDLAMVPRLEVRSSLLMPSPLSSMMNVPLSLSTLMATASSPGSSPRAR